MGCSTSTTDDDAHPSKTNTLPTTYDGLKNCRVKELKQYLHAQSKDTSKCIEKCDLIKLVLNLQQQQHNNTGKYVCQHCPKRFSIPSDFVRHTSYHMNKQQQQRNNSDEQQSNNNNNIDISGGIPSNPEKREIYMKRCCESMQPYFVSQQEWVNVGNLVYGEGNNVFISGIYNGWYMMTVSGSPKHHFMFPMTFDSDKNTLNAVGIDDIGQYTLNGIYDNNTLRIALRKQYINKHSVEIRLEYNANKNEFIGIWHIRYNKIRGSPNYHPKYSICWGSYGFCLSKVNGKRQQ